MGLFLKGYVALNYHTLNDWTLSLDEHLYWSWCNLFSKAFDSVLYDRLLLKLQAYRINGSTFKLVWEFFTGRCHCVKLMVLCHLGHRSLWCPQGSLLWPLLFTLYINELPSLFPSQLLMFADSSSIVVSVLLKTVLYYKMTLISCLTGQNIGC